MNKLSRTTNRIIVRYKDKTWSKRVMERDDYRCQVCGKSIRNNINESFPLGSAHHIIPRIYAPLREDINNGITLCYNHHTEKLFSAHNNAIWFSEFIKNKFPKKWEYINKKLIEIQLNKGKII